MLLGTAAARTTAARRASATSAVYMVKATAYEAVPGQTDNKPFVTADNSRIPKGYGSHTRWLALSRDLLRPWGGPFAYGDKVRVQGISPAFDGVYTVHDTMNRRYRHCLDVLVHPREHVSISQAGVKLQRVSPALSRNSRRSLASHRPSPKKLTAHRGSHSRQEVAQHAPRSRRRAHSAAVAVAPRPAKLALSKKRSPLRAHSKPSRARQQLAALPKRAAKKRTGA
ncbi:hypothetical protein FNT36_05855 [Hymenobacter setariae]|uniref:3D domain-containing protein n=1 Tax=Hymenobacter setariae TaxID=2594794 RepID=A0A558C4B0_9BACT|nr:hypothetical protein [Hymenobacter setariae]TVT43608.1 hypothetical protein FNT36_05855 [Hymenobacter setariae]